MNARFILFFYFFLLRLISVSGQHTLYLQNGTKSVSSFQMEETWKHLVSQFNSDTAITKDITCILIFDRLPDRELKNALKQEDIHLYEYIPKNAYLAGINPSIPFEYLKKHGISGIYQLQPEDKISRNLMNETATNRWTDQGLVRCWIHTYQKFRIDALKNQLLQWSAQTGKQLKIQHTIESLPALDVWVEPSAISTIALLQAVKFIDAAPLPGAHENNQAKTSVRSNTLQQTWNGGLNLDGSGIKLMMNDDGDVGNHIDYKNRTDQSQATPSPNFIDHANHIAGTLIGSGNRDPRYAGLAAGAFLKVHTYTTDPGSGLALFDFPNAYENEQIIITSTSQSDGCNAGYTSFAQLMDQQITQHPSLMHVFSAGNTGNNNCGYGAGNSWGTITGGHKQAKNVISVGNVTKDDLLVGSSSRGPASDGRIKPECVAVGTNVVSTTDFPEENNYTMKSGSSHACPGVAGTLALLYQGYKALYSNNLPSSALMKAALLNTCDDLGNPGPDFRFGFGRVNARRAYNLIKNQHFMEDSLSHGQIWDTTLTVPAGTHELRVMLYWNDEPGSVLSLFSLVNNLDLELTDPSLQTYLPWVLNSTPDATLLNQPAIRQIDTLNNIEQITIMNPAAGVWNIRVTGTQIPFEKQAFSLVYEVIQPELIVTYPNGSEKLFPGETERIRWDAYGNFISDFHLSYSSDAGNTWQSIQNNVSNALRHYDWVVPSDVSGNYMVRIENGSFSDISDTLFSVMYTADSLQIDTICNDMILLNWPDVSQASGYIIYQLGNLYMDSLTYTTQSQQWISIQSAPEENWFSVSALGQGGAISRRAYAIRADQYNQDCNTAISLNHSDDKPMIFPVPATKEVFISWAGQHLPVQITITIHEISGRKVMQQKRTVTEQIIHVDVSSLTNGVYLLCVQHNEGLNTWRFIKQ